MSVAASVSTGLQAAFLLARGRPDGIQLVGTDAHGARRSFWAIALCLPAVLCLRLIAWIGPGMQPNAGHALALDLLIFVVGWLAFVVLSYHVAPLLGRRNRWARYITVWNWCSVVENLLLVIGSVPGLLGAPPVVDEAVQLFTLGWALWLEWYSTRLALDVGGLTAAGLVLLDESLGLILAAIGVSLVGS